MADPDAMESRVRGIVERALTEVANKFTAGLGGGPLTDAAMGRITQLWADQIEGILVAVLEVYEAAAKAAAKLLGIELPDMDDLADRWLKDPESVPERVQSYIRSAENRLADVGDALWKAARDTLAAGNEAGEGIGQLRDRLRERFAAGGVQLGKARAERIARTETISAWNASNLDAAQDMPEAARPRTKTWLATHDDRTRSAHRAADQQTVPIEEPFNVGGDQLMFPGDPTGSPENTIACRCALAFGDEETAAAMTADAATDSTRLWHTPDPCALAYEGQETGDGRIFAPGALTWTGGPWPLQYAGEMLEGHRGAELAGSIEELGRDGDRIHGTGVLFTGHDAGAEAAALLAEGAPLGVSVDLDDVDVEIVDRRSQDEGEVVMLASLASATLDPLTNGGYRIRATNVTEHTAGAHPIRASHTVEWSVDGHGRVPAAELHAALTASGIVTASAGDGDDTTGQVVREERAGDVVMRITRARVRGATLVSMPAFAQARIVLEDSPAEALAAASRLSGRGRMRDVIRYVAGSSIPVRAKHVAERLGITHSVARKMLSRACLLGLIVRLEKGLYVGASDLPEGRPELVAAMSGDLDLPIVDDRGAEWDGDAAASRVLKWATSDDGDVDASVLGSAFLWRDPDADPETLAAYKLGVADVSDNGALRIVPAAVFAVASVLQGGRGGVDIPDEEQQELRERVSGLYRRLSEQFGEDWTPPWDGEGEQAASVDLETSEMEASAWQEFSAMPPMPSHWFREPTLEELPTDDGPVHVTADGRIYGWVARKGVCHDGYTGRCLTIDQLGKVDTTYFLRSQARLDDGTVARVGAFVMNAGHHEDGSDVTTTKALFDNSRTVAGIVTVGTNDRGMWFAGAAAPWLSQWDRTVFSACAPSGHWKRDRTGRWSLRAVLSVPVPGYPTRMAASAVVGRSNLALTASAAPTATPALMQPPAAPAALDIEALAAALAPVVVDEMERREAMRAEIEDMEKMLAGARAEIAASMAAGIKGVA